MEFSLGEGSSGQQLTIIRDRQLAFKFGVDCSIDLQAT